MAEYIEREAVLATMCKYCCEYDSEDTECTCNERLGVLEIPAADVAPVVHGRWTEQHHDKWDDEWDDTIHWYTYECSKCGAVAMNDYPYCPFCGAQMDGERMGDYD